MLTLQLTDGDLRWDRDGIANGIIVDPGTLGANVNDQPTGALTLLGTPTQNQTLTTSTTIADPDGLGTLSYSWQRSADGTTGWSNITAANTSSYSLTQSDVGFYIRAVASYTDQEGTSESVPSAATQVVVSAKEATPVTSISAPNIRFTSSPVLVATDVVVNKSSTSYKKFAEKTKAVLAAKAIDFVTATEELGSSIRLGLNLNTFFASGTTFQPNARLSYYSIDSSGEITTLTYDPTKGGGARFYDLNADGQPDFMQLSLIDGGYGDKDGVKNGRIVDPSTAGAVDLNPIFTASANSLTVGDPTDTSSSASLVVRASLGSRSSTVNQIGYVAINANESETITYDLLKARGTLLFGSLQNNDVPDISKMTFQRDINMINGQKLVFFEVVNNTLESLLKNGGLDSSFRILDVTKLTNSTASAAKGGSSVNLRLVSDVSGIGELISSQMGDAPIFDFTSLAGKTITGDVLVAREAAYNSTMGFYKLERSDGAVRDTLTNKLILPGEVGYAAVALRTDNLFAGFGSLATDNLTNKSLALNAFTDAGLLAPFARVANTGETYFSFTAENSDKQNHFRVLGSGVIGLEDLKGGGDRDFDDLIAAFNFRIIA
jgi:hypothetical protein